MIMRKVHLMAHADQNKCVGDRTCENVCPTGAIRVIEKKAVVDSGKCAACLRCMDICPEGAIQAVPRPQPISFRVDPAGVDQDELRNLCRKAHLDPEDVICPCTLTKASEVAAAILKGASTPEDISTMTGVRTACGIWCMALIQELLRAHGVELAPPKGFHWYNVDVGLWNLPDEVVRKYPEYRLEEARRLFQASMDKAFPNRE
jgi:Fe-S-cluster-containing hydrogenase component 2